MELVLKGKYLNNKVNKFLTHNLFTNIDGFDKISTSDILYCKGNLHMRVETETQGKNSYLRQIRILIENIEKGGGPIKTSRLINISMENSSTPPHTS